MNENAEKPWAVVTGASSGIGEALAMELSRRGHDVVVCGRDAERVEAVRVACGGKSIGFVADLAEPDGVDALVARLNEESIIASVLVNNAGVTVHGPFAETELALELRLVRLQIDAMLTLTKSVLPAMIARGSGRVMNVGSIYGFAGAPYQATYAATKAFLLGFTRSLRVELEGSGVSVTLVSPGLTRSRFRSRSGLPDRESSFMMDPDVVARKACEAIFAGRRGNVPGLRNRLFLLATKVFPERWFMGILSRVNARRRLGAKS